MSDEWDAPTGRTEEEELSRGRHAAQLLNDPLLQEALDLIDRAAFRTFRMCDPTDVQGLQNLRLMVKAKDSFVAHLRTTLETGKMAAQQMNLKTPTSEET